MQVPVLMYHEVLDVVERSKSARGMVPLYCLSVDQFSEQMEYLATEGIVTVTPDDFIGEGPPAGSRWLGVTFDDGLVGNHRFALPVLRRYGIKATVFVVVSQVGNERYMSWDDVRELQEAGVVIGSHTMSHPPLQTQSDDEVRYELGESRKQLEAELGSEIRHLSVPHGSYDDRVVRIAEDLGYATICTSVMDFEFRPGSPTLIGRVPVLDTYDLQTFKRLVAADARLLKRLVLVKRMKNACKRLIGINNYRRLYRRFFKIKLADKDA